LPRDVGARSPAQARTFFLSEPSRFVIDIANAQLAMPGGVSGEGPGAGVVRRFRYAPQANGVSRVVLDLNARRTWSARKWAGVATRLSLLILPRARRSKPRRRRRFNAPVATNVDAPS
jgi:hypothetical protein